MSQSAFMKSEIVNNDEKHSRTLDAQRQFLESLSNDSYVFTSQASRQKSLDNKKRAHELQHWKLLNEQCSDDLLIRLNDIEDAITKAIRLAPSTLTERLNIQDRLIEELEGLPVVTLNDLRQLRGHQDRIDLMTRTMRQLEVETLHIKLNRVFSETLQGSKSTEDCDDQEGNRALVKQVQDDLNSLYEDIDGVAAMVVAQDYGVPLRAVLDVMTETQHETISTRSDATQQLLQSMTTELKTYTKGCQALQSQRVIKHEIYVQLQAIKQQQALATSSASRTKSPSKQVVEQPEVDMLYRHLDLPRPLPAADADIEDLIAARIKDSARLETNAFSDTHASLSRSQNKRQSAVDMLLQAENTSQSDVGAQLDTLEQSIIKARMVLEEAVSSKG